MNTYFVVGGKRFQSREQAAAQINNWKRRTFSVHEEQNTEVTRKTARGNVITERVRGGNLEGMPRIISVRQLTTFSVVDETGYLHSSWHLTREAAEQERARWQGEADKLASFNEADIKAVHFHVLTLEEILERDADKIAGLEAEIGNARQNLKQANEQFDAAVEAYHKAVHYDELADEVEVKLREDHSGEGCWPDSDCRQCSYEPDIEGYLLDNSEDFEVEEIIEPEAAIA